VNAPPPPPPPPESTAPPPPPVDTTRVELQPPAVAEGYRRAGSFQTFVDSAGYNAARASGSLVQLPASGLSVSLQQPSKAYLDNELRNQAITAALPPLANPRSSALPPTIVISPPAAPAASLVIFGHQVTRNMMIAAGAALLVGVVLWRRGNRRP
jgi:hypothetical protein